MSTNTRRHRKRRELADDENVTNVCPKKSKHTPTLDGNSTNQDSTSSKPQLLFNLKKMFHTIDSETVAGVLESCGENVEAAIEKLKQLQVNVEGSKTSMDQKHNSSVHDHWIEPFFNSLSQASNQADAKSRLGSLLAAFEEAAIENFRQNSAEMKTTKDEFLALRTNNSILAQAVMSQHEKLKQNTARNEELDQMKQRVTQYEERVKDLELTNYSLTLHLRKALDQNYEDHRPRDIY